VVDYSLLVPTFTTKHPDFFVLNTSQFVNCTLNNNEVVRAVDDFLRECAPAFSENLPLPAPSVPTFARS
jgi:hypothetical protein